MAFMNLLTKYVFVANCVHLMRNKKKNTNASQIHFNSSIYHLSSITYQLSTPRLYIFWYNPKCKQNFYFIT